MTEQEQQVGDLFRDGDFSSVSTFTNGVPWTTPPADHVVAELEGLQRGFRFRMAELRVETVFGFEPPAFDEEMRFAVRPRMGFLPRLDAGYLISSALDDHRVVAWQGDIHRTFRAFREASLLYGSASLERSTKLALGAASFVLHAAHQHAAIRHLSGMTRRKWARLRRSFNAERRIPLRSVVAPATDPATTAIVVAMLEKLSGNWRAVLPPHAPWRRIGPLSWDEYVRRQAEIGQRP